MDIGSQESLHSEEKLPLLQPTSPECTRETEPLVCFTTNLPDEVLQANISTPGFPETSTIENTEDESSYQYGSPCRKLVSSKKAPPVHRPISSLETLIHLLKGNIGTGIFAMPDAFKNAGLVVGSIGLPIMAIICVHCMHILVECATVMKLRKGDHFMDYADVVEMACLTGPTKFARYSKFARNIINMFLCITQFGFCCVYIVFAATNLEQVVVHYFPVLAVDLRIYMAVLTALFLVPLCWIRKLKYLSPVSLVANILQSTSLVILFYFIFQDLPDVSTRPAFGSWKTLPLYFGTAVFAFEGISLVLPLQKDMRTPKNFEGWTGVLNTAMVIVSALYFAVGFYGYLKYGEDAKGSITLNLPSENILAQLVKLMMVLAILGSYAVQFYVPMEIILPTFTSYFHSNDRKKIAEYTLRTALVVMTFALAAAIPKLDLFISLVGAFSSSFLALIFPPILELVTYWPNGTRLTVAKDILIIIFGIIGFLAGSYASLEAVVNAFSS